MLAFNKMGIRNKALMLSSFALSLSILLQNVQSSDSALMIIYDNTLKVEYQKELTPTQVQNEPKIEWDGFESNALYTLIMYDPDAPSRANATASPFLHWLVINIPGAETRLGDVLAEYIGAGAPKGTGLHRYIFALYKQQDKIAYTGPFVTKYSRNGRPNFDLNGFLYNNHLGEILTSNQFQAEWDDYVPILGKQLSQGQ